MREDIKKWAERNYTHGRRLESVFIPDNISVNGEMFEDAIVFGDDECFDCGEYYHYMLHGDSLYQVYYDVDAVEDAFDLSDIDYTKPIWAEKVRDLDFVLD